MVSKKQKNQIVIAGKAGSSVELLRDLRSLIEQAREHVAQQFNTELVFLYWKIGERILKDILQEERAEYGKQVLETLAGQLTVEYGRGFSRSNLADMVRFAETFRDQKILQTLSGKLGWSHFRLLIYLDEPLKRDFYAEMCRLERWSVRTLQKKIGGMLFERTALSKKPEKLVEHELAALRDKDQLTPDLVFRDPYLLDFLGLNEAFSEKDMEAAILREMEQFLLELGSDFSFVARQKRITVDDEDFYIDLLFYHRGLRRLVVIELKLDKFSPGDKGQLELYLRWLDKYERREGEESPIGLILCADKSTERIELLSLDTGDIRVAAYITEVLPKPVLAAKLHDAIRHARERLASQPQPRQIEATEQ
jgi:predicted nuclease of restriction endonuclease-like (RecB) superfamily